MSIQNDKTNFVHLRAFESNPYTGGPAASPNSTGGATIAWKLTSDGVLKVGVAFCNLKDHYIKSEGRDLAAKRLDAGLKLADGTDNLFYAEQNGADILNQIINPEQVGRFATEGFAAELAHFMAGRTLAATLKYETLEGIAISGALRLVPPSVQYALQEANLKYNRMQRISKAQKAANAARLAAIMGLQKAAEAGQPDESEAKAS